MPSVLVDHTQTLHSKPRSVPRCRRARPARRSKPLPAFTSKTIYEKKNNNQSKKITFIFRNNNSNKIIIIIRRGSGAGEGGIVSGSRIRCCRSGALTEWKARAPPSGKGSARGQQVRGWCDEDRYRTKWVTSRFWVFLQWWHKFLESTRGCEGASKVEWLWNIWIASVILLPVTINKSKVARLWCLFHIMKAKAVIKGYTLKVIL